MQEKTLTEERLNEMRTGGRDKLIDPEGKPVLEVEDYQVWFPIKVYSGERKAM